MSGFKQRCRVHAAKPAAGTSVSQPLATAVLCRAAGWRPMVVGTAAANGSAARGKGA
jgi:hypothetical protein